MGQIFGSVEGIELPKGKWNEVRQLEEAYVEKIVKYAETNGEGKCKGKEIRFPVGDGYACYIVLSTKPVRLIHLAIGDAYHEPYVHRLTAKDIIAEVTRGEALRKLFSKA